MSDGGGDGQRQCRRGITPDVELGAALALADMAAGSSVVQARARLHTAEEMTDDEEMASTRLSLQLGRVGVQQSPSCSSSSSAGRPPAPSAAPGAAHHGPRPRHMLTEAEKEEKRLRRVLANRESARQTILRRQAIRDELARKVADLSSQNETMKKEKDVVMEEYLSLKETNEHLKAQAHHLSLSLF
ncbi:transcription factor HY5-like [Miscanthus floridulus]|uniref:transcription factor HY5-like n=1 Tax=Miscanthus floridulus TaxID=154761 RepID=UPI00345A2791